MDVCMRFAGVHVFFSVVFLLLITNYLPLLDILCPWTKTPKNIARATYCFKYDGYGELCDCEKDGLLPFDQRQVCSKQLRVLYLLGRFHVTIVLSIYFCLKQDSLGNYGF